MKRMSEVRRVPFEVSGLHDAVELMCNCSTIRLKIKRGKTLGIMGAPELHPCKLMASYGDGTLTVSDRKTGLMVSIRLDEAMAVMGEAAKAALDAAGLRLPEKEDVDVKEDATAQG